MTKRTRNGADGAGQPEDEIDFHLEMQTRRFIEAGDEPATARGKAVARMGDLNAALRESRAIAERLEIRVQNTSLMTTVIQDARYAVRVLSRTPHFTATSLLTLAVGIGATTTIFSVVNAVLLKKLPYPNAERTMVIGNTYLSDRPSVGAVAPEEFADYRTQSQAFERWAALLPQVSALTDDCVAAGCEPERVNQYAVSPELFDLLGVRPQLGRPFTAADGVIGAPRVVLIADTLWRQRYNADPHVVGRTISLAGIARVVIGVMPAGIRFPDEPVGYLKERADIWSPLNWQNVRDGRGNQYLDVLGLLRDGVSRAQAEADLHRIGEDFKRRFPYRYSEPLVHWKIGSSTLTEQMVGDIRTALVVLFGVVGCVLLIACANVANLTLARGSARRRELAIRSALGADRRRLVQQLLVETLALTFAGTALGVTVAAGSLQLLLALNPGNIPRLDGARIDLSVLLFASALALVTGLVVGLYPALRQAHADPQAALGDSVRGTDATSPRRRLRGLLVMAEVAMAVVVLTGAALLIRSFVAMTRVPIGVRAEGVVVARLTIPRATYDMPAKVFAFHRSIRERLAGIPGVTHASAVYPLPMSGSGWSGSVGIVGRPDGGGPKPHAEYAVAMPGYFSTVGIPLIDGRDFAESDAQNAPLVAVVDEEFARQFWPGQSAIGRKIATSGDTVKGPFQTVIGVVGHVRNKGARQAGEGQLYLAALQKPEYSLFFVTRTADDPRSLMAPVRSAVRAQDPKLPIAALSTLDQELAKFTARDRFNTLIFTVFASVALAIASIGLYGVLAFLVSQRTREIGIRLALGGQPGDLVRSVMLEALALTGGGLAIGLGGVLLLGRWLQELLFEVKPTDPVTYATIAGVMLAVSLAASVGPARRATKVDPVDVLRS